MNINIVPTNASNSKQETNTSSESKSELEHFDNSSNSNNVEIESKSNVIDVFTPKVNINPMVYEQDKQLATAASEFIGLPDVIVPAWGNSSMSYGISEILDDGANGSLGLHFNKCSKSCCATQYPVPFKLEIDQFMKNDNEKYVKSSYNCNNAWQNSGCVCLTQKQAEHLANRGENMYA